MSPIELWLGCSVLVMFLFVLAMDKGSDKVLNLAFGGAIAMATINFSFIGYEVFRWLS